MRDSTFVYLHAGRTVGIGRIPSSDWFKVSAALDVAHAFFPSVCFYPISGVSLSPCLPWRADLRGIGPLFFRPSVEASLLFTREGFRMPRSLGTRSPLAKGTILWLLQSVVVHDQSFRKSVLTIRCVLVTSLWIYHSLQTDVRTQPVLLVCDFCIRCITALHYIQYNTAWLYTVWHMPVTMEYAFQKFWINAIF